jgi:hypothetical protein
MRLIPRIVSTHLAGLRTLERGLPRAAPAHKMFI